MRLHSASRVLVVTIGVAAAVTVASALQESSQHRVLFEKAKFTMETKGDLRGAIALFEEIVSKYPNEREYAAQALLNIGQCYEKLGMEGARGAYQRLIKGYPGQTTAVAAAQERLDSLMRAASLAKRGEGDITIRKVLTPKGMLLMWAVSPDGRYLLTWETRAPALPAERRGSPESPRARNASTDREPGLFAANRCAAMVARFDEAGRVDRLAVCAWFRWMGQHPHPGGHDTRRRLVLPAGLVSRPEAHPGIGLRPGKARRTESCRRCRRLTSASEDRRLARRLFI